MAIIADSIFLQDVPPSMFHETISSQNVSIGHLSGVLDIDIIETDYNVEMDHMLMTDRPRIWTTGLGPCVAILLWAVDDRGAKVAHALAHNSMYTGGDWKDREMILMEYLQAFEKWLDTHNKTYHNIWLYVIGGCSNDDPYGDLDRPILGSNVKLIYYNIAVNVDETMTTAVISTEKGVYAMSHLS